MNHIWHNFLLTNPGASVSDTDISFTGTTGKTGNGIYALKHLTVLQVAGTQAMPFLQGQITCNINDITEENGSIGALCTAQGKVISTFILIKMASAYGLILPATLLDTVKSRLQKYILRADVQLTDCTDSFCLIGLAGMEMHTGALFSCTQTQDTVTAINLGHRQLLLANPDQAIEIWAAHQKQGYTPENSTHWRYLDILAGIPWLDAETSEQFIPQMLNLDKLGGISLNKGCYTGQEIVARTHYLGKAKRGLFLLAANAALLPASNSAIADDTGQVIGRVLSAAEYDGKGKVLCVLPIDSNKGQLNLPDYPNHTLTLSETYG